jgi:hypothetical protein
VRVKRLLLLASTAAAVIVPAGAHAAVPCRDKIYNEWYASGKISTTYPISCYHDALQHIPSDAQVYSNLGTDIKAALLAALAREKSGSGPASVGRGLTASETKTGQTKAAVTTRTGDSKNTPVAAAPITDANASGSTVPVPILVLGGIALLLAAAGAIGTGVKQYRKRSAS